MYEPISHLVYTSRGDDVVASIVNGKILMRDGKVLTLNQPEVIAAALKASTVVRAAVGMK
jgi:5-methylthioadenosine/S-adenosylhomocysteine deaminase